MKKLMMMSVSAVVLPLICCASEDYTYQSLTNLGPCASSRVLLMNNDTNETCPIQGQGYYDTNETATAVGGTFWVHTDTTDIQLIPRAYLNLLPEISHVLYQKVNDTGGRVALWTLVECRTGSAGYNATSSENGNRNYLPWSSTCQPIDPENFSAPISAEWKSGAANLGGIKQVAHISMRSTTDSCVYSPFYEDGIGEIFFDVVNGFKLPDPDSICVEVATDVMGDMTDVSFEDGLAWTAYKWEPVPCDMFVVEDKSSLSLPDENKDIKTLVLSTTKYRDTMYFRVRVKLDCRQPVRFRIRRLTNNSNSSNLDYNGLIFIDNIIASYPGVSAVISSSGVETKAPVDTDNRKNCKRASLGYVGAFSEPVLSKGLETACPRMSFSAIMNGLPSFVATSATVSKAECVYRWRYLDQAVGPWKTNLEENVSIIGGTNVVWNVPIEIPDEIGDIEYSYGAWVSGTRYKYFDFANNTRLDFPDDTAAETYVKCATNYFTRIRAGRSPWQEMHVVTEVITNMMTMTSVTNDWTMELTGDHSWRGFVDTRTNYMGKIAYIRIVGRNRFAMAGETTPLASKTWYTPEIKHIPDGYMALTEIPEGGEYVVRLDCSTGYLAIDFNDESGTFIINPAEYQDFNMWTPPPRTENRYVGNYVNTSYVGTAKQTFRMNPAEWPVSRSSTAFWWENFDVCAGSPDYPFNVPYGQNNLTPNGWAFDNGMYVNGFFTAVTNKTTYGVALQLKGGGTGSVGLIDPINPPNGIGTISFSARLAQTLDFEDFYCYLGGFTDKNYAFSAKATMTHTPQHNNHPERNDISTGCPSISLAAYYRPGYGCYEFRVSRIYATSRYSLWGNGNGALEIAIYRWNLTRDSDGNECWTQKKLASKRLGTGGDTNYNRGNYLAPVADSTMADNDNWTSVYVAAYNTGSGTYVEGAISEDQVVVYSGLSGDTLLAQAVRQDMSTSGRMFSVSVTDNEMDPLGNKLYHEKGTYGVCSTECPAAFGALNRHSLAAAGPYYNSASKFTTSELQRDSLADGDWGSVSLGRMMSWTDFNNVHPDRDSYLGVWQYGVCAAPVSQRLYLLSSPSGNSSGWKNAGLSLLLESYQPTNIVFSPHTLEPANIKLAVGSSRTDVVVDDLQLSQWKAETGNDSLGETRDWAYTGGWISTTTNDVYQSAGASTDDPVASITKCGFLKYEVEGEPNEYVYVFTNTTAGALGGYAQFIPNCDLTVVGVFGIGGGGGGGAGGGGGGGGGAFQITNAANYTIGEVLRVYVGLGGNSSGWNASASGGTPRAVNGSTYGTSASGGNSYYYGRTVGSATQSARTTYYGYGGGRGGNWRDTASGTTFAQGQNGGSYRGGGGGSARPRGLASDTKFTADTDKLVAVNSRNQGCGAGAGVTNVTAAAGGGGGGGLVTFTSSTVNFSNTNNVTYAGTDGAHGVAGSQAGNGGRGFPISAIGDEAIRKAIMRLTGLSESDRLGGGGGGGAGTNATANVEKQGLGAISAGKGRDGGSDGAVSAATYAASLGAKDADRFRGGGGGGGAIHAVLNSGGAQANNWLTRGGRGGDGLVVLHVRVNNRAVLLQPMRGEPDWPMSVRTPLMNGISMVGLSWKWADEHARLRVQVMTDGVNESNIDGRSKMLDGWEDVGVIDFSQMSAADRDAGSTNLLIGLRAPISGVARVLVDPNLVNDARASSTNANANTMYGTVAITSFVAYDEPALEARSWFGWNIMPTDRREYGSLYDHLYDASIDPVRGRTCALNFSGRPGVGEDDPLFADEAAFAGYDRHDPFIQTPNFTNGIGKVMFLARMLETNGVNGWVTISGATYPNADDKDWVVITNIEITADSPFFKRYEWWMPSAYSSFTAVRLSAWAAKDGRYAAASPYSPNPIQRVLIDDVLVTQPLSPGLAFAYPPRPYRYNGAKKGNPAALPQEQILSPDEQPVLGESFGMQVQLVPAGADEHLDRSSIRVYMSWYAGESPWGFVNWRNQNGAVLDIELVRAEGWSENNLIYHSSIEDTSGLIPPQLVADTGYRVVQYQIYVTYKDKNGNPHERVMEVGSDWTEPPWYVFANGSPYNQGPVKCAYTLLDEISPKRVWINEINMFNGDLNDTTHQYIEVAVPQGLSLNGWTMSYFGLDDRGADGKYISHPLVSFGSDVVSKKTEPAVNQYAFIAIQSPATKAAGTYNTAAYNFLDDGTWGSDLFNGDGVLDVRKPYAFRLLRPSGIVEHEVVFMCTNIYTSLVRYRFDGTNFVEEIKRDLNDEAWIYVGADNNAGATEDYSLGVFTNHGESVSCWTNWMKQTPGNVNRLTDGTPQYIAPTYFDPPEGDYLWIYAEVDAASQNTVWVESGEARVNSRVLVVPRNPMTGTFSTSITYHVKDGFEIDAIVTNEIGKAGGVVAAASGRKGVWTLDLNNITIPENSSHRLMVTASSRRAPSVWHGDFQAVPLAENLPVQDASNGDGRVSAFHGQGLDGYLGLTFGVNPQQFTLYAVDGTNVPTVVTNVVAEELTDVGLRGVAISTALGVAVTLAYRTTETMYAFPLAGGDPIEVTRPAGYSFDSAAFSPDGQYLFSNALNGESSNQYYVKWAVSATDGSFSLTKVGSIAAGGRGRNLAYARINGRDLVFALVDTGKVAVLDMTGTDAATWTATDLVTDLPGHSYGSLCVSGVNATPHLTVATSMSGADFHGDVLNVYELTVPASGAVTASLVESFDEAAMTAVGFGDISSGNLYGNTVYVTDDESTLYFARADGNLYAVQYDMAMPYVWLHSDNGDGTVTITGVTPEQESLVIPAAFRGKPVTGIGDCAFKGCDKLASVTISDSVTNIGDDAFYGCNAMLNVIFNGNAPSIGESAFHGVGSGCTVHVKRDSTGWGVAIPGIWNGMAVEYIHHEVVFDPNGGECGISSISMEDGTVAGELPLPTRADAVFRGWFTVADGGDKVNEVTVITNAITLYAHWLTEVDRPVVSTGGMAEFRTDSCEVTITCATEGVRIYYTDDGTTPKKSDDYLYAGPITIADTTTFKAVAVIGSLQSEYVTVTITKKLLTLEEALNVNEGVAVATDASIPWRAVILNGQDARSPSDAFAAQSGEIGNRTNTWLSALVSGAGTMTFWCKTSCEHDEDDTFTWDRFMVYTNGVEIAEWRMDGETEWTQRTLAFAGGENAVRWVYFKDRTGAEGEDCAWVDGVTWMPSGVANIVVDVGGGKSVTVPGAWIEEHSALVEAAGGDASAALAATAANGRKVWECYALGLDPEDNSATNDFKITSFPLKADGTPDIEHIVFDPPQAKWNVPGARAVIKGAANLNDAEWLEVTEGNKGGFRFFKVEVVLP